MAAFLTIVLSIWGLMHAFVFWRLGSVPWVTAHISRKVLWIAAALLWASFPLGRILHGYRLKALAVPLELFASNWVGVLFLLVAALLAIEVVTLGGWVFQNAAPLARGWGAVAAILFAAIAFIQGLRPPVVQEYNLTLPHLPSERDGTVLVHISDLHLGTQLGQRWLQGVQSRVNALNPDIIVFVGDIIDGDVSAVEPLVPTLKEFRARFGVWGVTGNHEYYAKLEPSVRLLETAGFQVLRDTAVEVKPGLVLAGVDDLTSRQQFGLQHHAVERALSERPPGATILLSHSPWEVQKAASLGSQLMLSGHTHNGQIWPFTYLVKTRYPFISGYYQIDKMHLIVGRGTGTWGPRMRLWRPGEIIKITLRAPKSVPS